MSTVFEHPSDLLAAVGADLGTTDWVEITQERVDPFAEATGDLQWIHEPGERADAGPFGGPIAHGYLTLSMVNDVLPAAHRGAGRLDGRQLRHRQGAASPHRCRSAPASGATAALTAADPVNGGVQATVQVTVEVEGNDKPACVVETLSRFLV